MQKYATLPAPDQSLRAAKQTAKKTKAADQSRKFDDAFYHQIVGSVGLRRTIVHTRLAGVSHTVCRCWKLPAMAQVRGCAMEVWWFCLQHGDLAVPIRPGHDTAS